MCIIKHNSSASPLHETPQFSRWLEKLRDPQARHRIQARLDRLALGLPGDTKPVGEGVFELRIDHGPGYRVYYKRHMGNSHILLIGGDKRSQQQDIATSLKLARDL